MVCREPSLRLGPPGFPPARLRAPLAIFIQPHDHQPQLEQTFALAGRAIDLCDQFALKLMPISCQVLISSEVIACPPTLNADAHALQTCEHPSASSQLAIESEICPSHGRTGH